MTYRELDGAANRLAHLFIGRGAGPGRCVALLLSRSAEAIVAILAVLKTGRGVSADRSGAAGGAGRVHARRRHADRRDHHRRAGRPARRARSAGHRCRTMSRHPDYPCTAFRRRPPVTTSPTSSTPRALPVSPRGWPSPTERDPTDEVTACTSAAGGGVVAVAFLGLRRLGVGDLGRAATWRAAGGGARVGGPLTGRLPRLLGR